MSIDRIPPAGVVLINANGTMRSFETDKALTENVVRTGSPSYTLDVLASRAADFVGNPKAVTALQELARRIVAECVAAKLTEEDQPKIVDIPKQNAAKVGLGSVLSGGLAGANPSLAGRQWSVSEIQQRSDEYARKIEAKIREEHRRHYTHHDGLTVITPDSLLP